MQKTKNRFGFEWRFNDEHDGWMTDIGRCRVVVKQYTEDYYRINLGVKTGSQDLWFSLNPRETENEAMIHGVAWALKYDKVAPLSVEETFNDIYRRWPSLYQTRLSIITHLMFVVGNGYVWLDGALVPVSPELEGRKEDGPSPSQLAEIRALIKADPSLQESYTHVLNHKSTKYPIGPMPDDGGLREFYPVSESSEICNLPANIQDDWLLLAYEAAVALRDRTAPLTQEQKQYWYTANGRSPKEWGRYLVEAIRAKCTIRGIKL